MAFKQNVGKTFIKYKEGKFYKTSDKEQLEPLGDFEGRLIDISLKNETINGQPVEKLVLELDGGDGLYSLGLSFNSSLASKLIGFLKSVDLSKVITLSPAYKKEGEKEIRTIFVKEGTDEGTPYAKQFYTKDGPNQTPKMKKLKSGKWSKDEFEDFYRDVVGELKASLGGKTQKAEFVDVSEDEEEDDQKLPF